MIKRIKDFFKKLFGKKEVPTSPIPPASETVKMSAKKTHSTRKKKIVKK